MSTATHLTPNDLERFYSKISKEPTERGCLEWMAALRNGYGHFNIRKSYFYAHRLIWELECGPIPKGLVICHRCDNPRCVNVEHLFLGTKADNARDMRDKGRDSVPPVLTGERNHKAKLSAEQANDIRSDKFTEWKQRDIAKRFGISQASAWRILHRKAWKHI